MPEELAERLALAKARDVAARHADGLVIGADTVVARHGRLYGKPRDEAEAAAMLRDLRGGPHRVVTGIAVVRASDGAVRSAVVPATVVMRPYGDADIAAYVATGEPMDKAGAYAIQGIAGRWIGKIEGDYFNVVGLPVAKVYRILKQSGALK